MLQLFWTQSQNYPLNSAQTTFETNNIFLKNSVQTENKSQWHIMCQENALPCDYSKDSLDGTPESDFKSTVICKI